MKKLILTLTILLFLLFIPAKKSYCQAFTSGIEDSTAITSASPSASWLNNPRFTLTEVVIQNMAVGDSIALYNITETNDTIIQAVKNLSTGSTTDMIRGVTGTVEYLVLNDNIQTLLAKSIDSGAGVISGRRNIKNRKLKRQ